MTARDIASEMFGMISTREQDENVEVLAEKIRGYARQKCKEQRELCANEDGHPYGSDHILNAPEPKFD